MTNRPAFGPDGALYFCQAATRPWAPPTPLGQPRGAPAQARSCASTRPAPPGTPLDAQDVGRRRQVQPLRQGRRPLTIYATGVRNAYDLVWHSNGHLYAPTNGSAAGGNTPAGPGVPAVTERCRTGDRFLFRHQQRRLLRPPQPASAASTSSTAATRPPAWIPTRSPSTPSAPSPTPHWQPAAFDFGMHVSPDGAIEYKGSAFGGALDHKLLVARYSGGGDVVALNVAADGSISGELTGIEGITGFVNPLDLVEYQPTGNLYVAELGGECITLLRVPGQGTSGGVDGATGGGDSSDPGPAAIPDADRTRARRRLIRGIAKFANRHDLSAPDISTTPGDELKAVMADLKDNARRDVLVRRIDALAVRKKYPLPNTDTYSLPQLRTLRHQIQKARTGRGARGWLEERGKRKPPRHRGTRRHRGQRDSLAPWFSANNSLFSP